MKKRIFLVVFVGLLVAAGMVLTSCGLRDCDAGGCGRILMDCQNTVDVSCNGLLGGNTGCSSACG